MAVFTCTERSSEAPNATDAVWVPNQNQNQLFFPYVSSCVSVTLVCENGLVGGHASQVNTDAVRPVAQPAANLQAVIQRMIGVAPAGQTGALKRIWFIGLIGGQNWDFAGAEQAIGQTYGKPRERTEQIELSPVDVVFDSRERKVYAAHREAGASQGAAATIADVKAIDAGVPY